MHRLPISGRCSQLLAISSLLLPSLGCNGGASNGGTNGSGDDEIPKFVSIGTAPLGGTFYQVGAGISDALNEGKESGGWRQSTAESTGGSLENFRRLESEDIQIGMANSTITYFAVRGEGGFEKKHEVKTIMTMFPLVAMFVTKEGSGIERIEDLKGKRVVVGPEGAGFEYFIRPILNEHGVKYDEFEDVYAGMQTSVGYLQDESCAATFLGGGLRSQAITSAASTMNIKLVPYGADERQNLIDKYPSFGPVTVPTETYKGQTEDFDALNVGAAHLLVRSDASEDFVYRVTKVIYEGREKIAETHAAGKAINAKNVVLNVGTDFHPGAIKYYKEIDIWPSDETDNETAESDSNEEAADDSNSSDNGSSNDDADK